ncbi:MAG: hypothetical protein HYY40_12415 [Bacteroidetes bacterium]|nr:hypothetical protein [Bacteroidota bacterium]
MEEREGTILTKTSDGSSGRLRDASTGNESDFTNPAKVSIDVGNGVIYITIVAGNGRIINVIKEVRIHV